MILGPKNLVRLRPWSVDSLNGGSTNEIKEYISILIGLYEKYGTSITCCNYSVDPMRWVSRLLSNKHEYEEPCIPRGAIGDTVSSLTVSPIAPRGMHGSSYSCLFDSNLLTHRIGLALTGEARN